MTLPVTCPLHITGNDKSTAVVTQLSRRRTSCLTQASGGGTWNNDTTTTTTLIKSPASSTVSTATTHVITSSSSSSPPPPLPLSQTASPTITSNSIRNQTRRSWHIGYGTLHDVEEVTVAAVAGALNGAVRRADACKKEKLIDSTTLLETSSPKARPIAAAANSTRHSNFHTNFIVPTHSPIVHPVETSSRGLLARWRAAGRRGSGSDENDKLVTRKTAANFHNNNNQSPSIIKHAESLVSLRKCETVLTLAGILRSTSSAASITPLQPQNRLRIPPNGSHSLLCSRCSSLLTLASNSRYSLDSTSGEFVRLPSPPDVVTSTANDHVDGGEHVECCTRRASVGTTKDGVVDTEENCIQSPKRSFSPILCKLCLAETPGTGVSTIQQCECAFCMQCMKSYVKFEISEGAYDISCPDAQCPAQGVLQEYEIKRLVDNDLVEKHRKYRLNREVELDKTRCWCPRAGCETVCSLCPKQPCSPQNVCCPTCSTDFCSNCKLEWHEGTTCEAYGKKLVKEGKKPSELGIPFDSDLIKFCPMCGVPIEKDEGCAQMMCKRCKHVFCWYCLASLDDDFLLRHYDKGPCKNKLGHTRASVIWHRTQVIGIFAGFGILLLVASPLLLLVAPCIVCCKCRMCNAGTTKLDNEDEVQDDTG